MRRRRRVVATNRATAEAFNAGTAAVVLVMVAGIGFSYRLSVLSLWDAIVLAVLTTPVAAIGAAIVLGWWLGYADEADHRSRVAAASINGKFDE